MDPYKTPNTPEESEYNITNIVDHPRYDLVLKLVLRDEKKESIYKRMVANDVDEHESKLLMDMAQKVRVSIIKSDSYSQIFGGVIILGIALSVFCFFWFKIEAVPRGVLGGCVLGAAYGVWRIIDGITGVMYASNRRGEIADIINE